MCASGEKSLAQTMGFNKSAVKALLDQQIDTVQTGGALDFSGAEGQIKGSMDRVQTNKGGILLRTPARTFCSVHGPLSACFNCRMHA